MRKMLVLVLLAAGPAAAAEWFSDDFEEGDYAVRWDIQSFDDVGTPLQGSSHHALRSYPDRGRVLWVEAALSYVTRKNFSFDTTDCVIEYDARCVVRDPSPGGDSDHLGWQQWIDGCNVSQDVLRDNGYHDWLIDGGPTNAAADTAPEPVDLDERTVHRVSVASDVAVQLDPK